jgi:hypothetical protein
MIICNAFFLETRQQCNVLALVCVAVALERESKEDLNKEELDVVLIIMKASAL